MLEKAGLPLQNISVAVSDHEPAVRNAYKMMGFALLGCECHALQLSCKHVLPPLREPVPKPVRVPKTLPPARDDAEGTPDEDSSSSSSSTSSSGSSSNSSSSRASPAAAAPAAAAPAAAPAAHAAAAPEMVTFPQIRIKDPVRIEVMEALTSYARKIRDDIRWYTHHPDVYFELLQLPGAHAFQTECSSRWDTALLSWSYYLGNVPAMRLLPKIGDQPDPPDDQFCKLVADVIAVLTPVRTGTLAAQRDGIGSLASQYLPLWHGVVRLLGDAVQERSLKLVSKRTAPPAAGP